MGITVEWDTKDKKVLRFTFQGDWTWEQLFEAYKKAATLLNGIAGTAQTIMDFRESGRIPLDGMFLKARLIAKESHERQGDHIVFLGSNRLIVSSLDRLKSFYPRIMPGHIYHASSLEEARKILEESLSKPD